MPNTYFRFKQFTIHHGRCAMKVGTDGVLLGAWADNTGCETILDIGTGTGLIALMLAQRNKKAMIDAIDVDEDAIWQARENIGNSPFVNRINCKRTSLQEYAEHCGAKYDLIVSNPPFFAQSLKSPDRKRMVARHDDSLPVNELLSISSVLLTGRGRLSIIYPYENKETLCSLAKGSNMYIVRITNVYPTPASMAKRVLMEFSREETPLIENDLIIEKGRHVYSDEFTALAHEFYLKM